MSAPASWRDRIKVHEAADLFPMMSDDELRELGEDIRKHGLKLNLAFFVNDRHINGLHDMRGAADQAVEIERRKDRGELPLLDGRNRLDAMQIVCILDEKRITALLKSAKICWADDQTAEAFVASLNAHRRHLKPEQKREIIAKLLKAHPEKSDRAIAKEAGASPQTVGRTRAKSNVPTET